MSDVLSCGRILLALALTVASMPGCDTPTSGSGHAIVSALGIPAEWTLLDPANTSPVPGNLIASYAGPDEARLVVYRTLYVPGADSGGLAAEMAARLTNEPGITLLENWTRTVGPHKLGCLSAELAPGAHGSEPRRRDWVCLPRNDGTYWLRWEYPASVHDRMGPRIEQQIGSLAHLGPDTGSPGSSAY